MQQGIISSVRVILDGPVSSRPCWSSSASTVLDPEQAALTASSISIPLHPAFWSRKDFGVSTVPARLRDDPGRQLDLGWRAQFGLSLICTFGVYAIIDMMFELYSRRTSVCQSLLLSTSPKYDMPGSCGAFLASRITCLVEMANSFHKTYALVAWYV